jgi:hypothetical protein
MWVIIVLLSFLAGGFVVYIISEKAIFSLLSKEKEYYIRELQLSKRSNYPYYISIVKLLKERKEHYKSELERLKKLPLKDDADKLKEQIQLLSSENKELKEKLSDDNSVNEENVKLPDKPVHDTKEEVYVGTSHKIYFTIPEKEGRFKNVNSKSNNNGNCHYRIEFELNKNTGQLFYISGELDRRAIENIDACLIPVCEIENISNRKDAFRIELIQPGTVYLKNDSWVIDPANKVKIKLV